MSEQKKQTTTGSQHSHQLAPLEQKHSKEDHTTTRRRQQWSSFGAAAKKNSDGGGDFSVTMRSGEEVFIESPFKKEHKVDVAEVFKYVPPSLCPGNPGTDATSTNGSTETITPPASTLSEDETNHKANTCLFVKNISQDTRESDVRHLFSHYGRVTHVHVPTWDDAPDVGKGHAYVTFYARQEAQSALDNLDGYGFHHMVIRVEFSRTREKSEASSSSRRYGGGGGNGMKFTSGYGKALPQTGW